MGLSQTILGEQDRQKLDGIVQKMIANGESEENIRFVVGDFKQKYSKKKDGGSESVSAGPSTLPPKNPELDKIHESLLGGLDKKGASDNAFAQTDRPIGDKDIWAHEKQVKQEKLQSLIHGYSFEEAAARYNKPNLQEYYPFAEKNNATAGKYVEQMLNDPDVLELAKSDPVVGHKLEQAKANWYSHFPQAAKKAVAQKIGQKREDQGKNSWFLNNPGKESTDKTVEQMVNSGELSSSEALTYQKEIQPLLAQSAFQRGIIHDNPIPTEDLVHGLSGGITEGAEGVASTLRNVANAATLGNAENEGYLENSEARKERMTNDEYATARIKPNGIHEIASTAGHLAGYVGTMALAQAMGGKAGIEGETLNKLVPFLFFEGQNAERAKEQHPDNPAAQVLQTWLTTYVDMNFAKLLPTEKIAAKAGQSFSREIAPEVEALTNGGIDKVVAAQSIGSKLKDIGAKALNLTKEVAAGNTKTAIALGTWDLAHKGIESILSGGDLSMEDAVLDNLNSAKTNWLASSLLSVMGARGLPPKINASIVREMANNPEHFHEVIDNNDNFSPEQKAEAHQNLDQAATVVSDLNRVKDMSQAQKDKYMLSKLSSISKVLQAQKSGNSIETLKASMDAAKDEETQKDIVSGKDKATEFERVNEKPEEPVESIQPQKVEIPEVSKKTDAEVKQVMESSIPEEKSRELVDAKLFTEDGTETKKMSAKTADMLYRKHLDKLESIINDCPALKKSA
jgi:hypothetical protein